MVRITTCLTSVCLLALLPSCGRSPLEMLGSQASADGRAGTGPDVVTAAYSKEANLYYLYQGAPTLEDGDVYGFLVRPDDASANRSSVSVIFDSRQGEFGAFRPASDFRFLGDRMTLLREDLLKAILSAQSRGAYGEGANWEGTTNICVCDGVEFDLDVTTPDDCTAAGGTPVVGDCTKIAIPVP